MTANANGHALVGPGDGEILEAGGNRVVIKVATAGQLVCEYTAPPRFAGPPLHVHPGFDETFIALDGRIEVRVRDRFTELTAGAVAHISGRVPHTFRNPDCERARFLLICTPGGFEHFFRGMAARDNETIAAISERFGYRPIESIA